MSIGRNTTIGMAVDLTVFGLGIVVSIVLTRSLGPEGRGVYALLVSTNYLLTNVSHLGLASACSTFLARRKYGLDQVNTVAALVALGMGALAFLITTLLFPLLSQTVLPNVSYDYLVVALLLVPATIYQVYWNSMMMGSNRVLLMNQFNLGVNIVSAVLMVFVVGVLQKGIPGFLAVWAFTLSAGALASMFLAARIERPGRPTRSAFRDMLHFGLRGYGTNVAYQLFLRFDIYAVNFLVGTKGVGFYSLSTSLSERVWVLPNALQAASVGKISQLPHEESALLTAKVVRTTFLIMLSAAVPFAIVSPWLIPFLYGSEFFASVLPLVILLVGATCLAATIVLNNYVIGQMQRPGLLSIISWLELGVSVPLYIGFTMWLGIVGAAIASSATYMLATIGTTTVFLRDSRLPISAVLVPTSADFRDYARVLRAAIGGVIAVLPGRGRSRV